jgi:hypothetical protein
VKEVLKSKGTREILNFRYLLFRLDVPKCVIGPFLNAPEIARGYVKKVAVGKARDPLDDFLVARSLFPTPQGRRSLRLGPANKVVVAIGEADIHMKKALLRSTI